MKKLKVLALSLLLATPMVINAAGMGIYVPFGVANSSSVTNDWYGNTIDKDYEPAVGFGLAFDSNIAKDKLFNYRLGLEYMKVGVDNVNGWPSDQEYSRFNMVHTFGFGVLRKEMVRLWVGPRINIAMNTLSDGPYTDVAFEFGIAPAVGVNLNLGRLVSLGFDMDYRFATLAGAWEYDGVFYDDDSYSGSASGLTARFYVLFRFGETFQKQAPQSANQGVVDQSL